MIIEALRITCAHAYLDVHAYHSVLAVQQCITLGLKRCRGRAYRKLIHGELQNEVPNLHNAHVSARGQIRYTLRLQSFRAQGFLAFRSVFQV